MTLTSTDSAPIRVLHSLAAPDGTTKYVDQMTDGAPDDVDVQYFSWRRALRGDYDVLHLHWPEFLVRAGSARKRWIKRMAMRGMLVVTRVRRIPIVRTVHNVHPHENGTSAEARLLRAVDRRTTLFIRLNETTALDPDLRAVTILHGHYRDRFAKYPRAEREPGTVLYFGIIRPRKNVDVLIDAYRSRPRPGSRLRIVGAPTPELRRVIETRVAGAADVSARLAFVDDADLVLEVSAASLVVLPYTEMHNSGAALVALSLDTPVLVPRSPANTALSREVGPGWITEYDGALTDGILTDALQQIAANPPTGRPRLQGRDWNEVGRQHRDAYRSAIAASRRGGRP